MAGAAWGDYAATATRWPTYALWAAACPTYDSSGWVGVASMEPAAAAAATMAGA